jgi:hypothetical protein
MVKTKFTYTEGKPIESVFGIYLNLMIGAKSSRKLFGNDTPRI